MSKKCCTVEKSKKDIVITDTRRGKKWPVLIVIIVAIVLFTYLFFKEARRSFQEVKAVNGAVRISIPSINDGKAHFFTYKIGNKDINFFVLKSSDGIIRAAFDTCDVCYSERRGYRQKGDYMVCNNCDQRFPSVSINEIRGGCNPAPLDRKIDGEYLVINTSAIEEGRFYF